MSHHKVNEGDVYSQLARHLDNLPDGFPATGSGVELVFPKVTTNRLNIL